MNATKLSHKEKIKALPFFQHVKWRPDARELRRFAVAMLIGFAVLGLLSAWRAGGISTSFDRFVEHRRLSRNRGIRSGVRKSSVFSVYLPTSIIGYVVSNVILTLMFFLRNYTFGNTF